MQHQAEHRACSALGWLSMATYWLGVLTIPAILLAAWLVFVAIHWVRWWFVWQQPGFHGGKGVDHDAELLVDERWAHTRHTHWWPPDTPWWIVHSLEPVRVWLCLRHPHRRRL